MASGVYKITCLVDGKIYIGSSKCIENRFKVHKRQLRNKTHNNPHMKNAWSKHGEENFTFEVVEYCDESVLLEREQFWMDLTLCYDRSIGFNNCLKSDRPLGYVHTEDNKVKMSLIKKEQLKNGVIRINVFQPKGYKHTSEAKDKIRLSKIGERNHRYGFKEDKEKTKSRMKNMLSKPRWNTGLTAKDDPRIEKLKVWKGKLPPNAIKHTLIDLESGAEWTELSLKGLSKLCPLSSTTLWRLKINTAGIKITNKYKLVW